MTTGQVHFPTRELAVRFIVWPARTLFVSQFFVLAGRAFPGLPNWIEATRRGLSSELFEDLLVLNAFGLVQKIVDEQLLAGLHKQDIPSFLEWVDQFDAKHLLELIKDRDLESLSVESDGSRRLPFGLTDTAVAWEGVDLSSRLWDRLSALRSDDNELHALLVSTLSRFWENHLQPELDDRSLELQESVSLGARALSAPRTFEGLLESLVGRRRQVDEEASAQIKEILAVPVLHLGPYARSSQVDLDPPVFVIEFEASRFLERSRTSQVELKASAFRALGDPSRLRIVRLLQTGEHYGGQIVEHVGLSQATVSGHLRLLVAEGIVAVRRDGNTKYYSLNLEFLTRLENAIAQLKGDAPAG